jgi:cytochrome P450
VGELLVIAVDDPLELADLLGSGDPDVVSVAVAALLSSADCDADGDDDCDADTRGDADGDVLTRLIQGEKDDEKGGDALSEVELLQNCVFLLNAGHETTTNLIGNALITLQEWPEQREQLKADLKAAANDEDRAQILGLAVDEFLRFESSNQLSNRRALQATQVNGVNLPAGALVTLCIGAANRDPAVYEQPEALNLRRTGNKHLAFGFGVHQCAGLSLARLEGRIAIGRFLQRFPDYQLAQAPLRGGRARFRGFLNAPFRTA